MENRLGRAKFKCQYFESIQPDVVNAEAGWWFPEDPGEAPSLHGLWKSNINILVDDSLEVCDPVTGGWVHKGVPCRVCKAE